MYLDVWSYSTHVLKPLNVLNEKPVGIEPGQEHILDDVLNSLLLKSQGLCPHHGRVDQVQPEGVCSKLLDHINGVRVVLETFAHFLTVTSRREEEGDMHNKHYYHTACYMYNHVYHF